MPLSEKLIIGDWKNVLEMSLGLFYLCSIVNKDFELG